MTTPDLMARLQQWLEDHREMDDGPSIADAREMCDEAAQLIEEILAVEKQ